MAVITHFMARNNKKITHSRLLGKDVLLNKYLKYQIKKKKKCMDMHAGRHLNQSVFFIN